MKPYVRITGKIFTPVWSGSGLGEKYRRFKDNKFVGECWETSAVPGHESDITDNPNMNLADYLRISGIPTPPLVKIIHTEHPLSIQVHPDEYAAEKHGGIAKSEFWYVLDAKPGAELIYGTADGVTLEDTKKAIIHGNIEHLLQRVTVKPGDTFMIPEGMIHSLGAGITVLEVQNCSGTTYRIKDFVGNREIHPMESVDSIHIYSGDEALAHAISTDGKLSGASLPGDPLVSVRDYAMTRYTAERGSENLRIDQSGVYIFCEHGHGSICGTEFATGDSFFLGSSGCKISLADKSSILFIK